MEEYKSNHNVVYSCRYHIVFCSKYRRSVLTDGVDVRLKELITQICASTNVDIIGMEIMPDHVHLLLGVDPQYGIRKAVSNIKGTTSRILRSEFPQLRTRIPTLWTNSYFCETVGATSLEAVKKYIENQKRTQRDKVRMG